LGEVLVTRLHPGWPHVVQDYRERRLVLDQLLRTIGRESEEALILVAHAEAVARAGSRSAVMDRFADTRAVELYLSDAWQPIRNAI
jgi:hypothetical protein